MKKSKYQKSNIPVQNHLKGKAKRQAKQTVKGPVWFGSFRAKSKFHE